MRKSITTSILLIASTLLSGSVLSEPETRHSNGVVVMTFQNPGESGDMKRSELERERSKERQVQLKNEAAGLRDGDAQMRKHGFITVSEAQAGYASELLSMYDAASDPALTAPQLGFTSTVLSGGLSVDRALPTMVATNGYAYALISFLRDPEIDLYAIEETALGGEHGLRSIRAPRPNVEVNGKPAWLVVHQTSDGRMGQTKLWYLTPDSVIEIWLAKPVFEGQAEYNRLFEIAHSL